MGKVAEIGGPGEIHHISSRRNVPKLDQGEVLKELVTARDFAKQEEATIDLFLGRDGLSSKTALECGIGFRANVGRSPELVLPVWSRDEIANILYEPIQEGSEPYWKIQTKVNPLWNGRILEATRVVGVDEEGNAKAEDVAVYEVFVVDSFRDALALAERGFKSVVARTSSVRVFPEIWLQQLERVREKVLLVIDKEEKRYLTQRDVWDRVRQIGIERAYLLEVPARSVVDYFSEGHTALQFAELANNAVRHEIPDIAKAKDAWGRLKTSFEAETGVVEEFFYDLQLSNLNQLAGDLKPASVVLMCASEKIGKTALMTQIMAANSKADRPGLIYCLEENEASIVSRIVQSEFGVTKSELRNPEVIARADALFERLDLSICTRNPPHTDPKRDIDEVIKLLEQAIKRYALRAVALDNVNWFVRNSRNPEQDVAYISGELLSLARREDVVALILTHPKKLEEGKRARGRDVKYSGALTQDCHVMMFLHRAEVDRDEKLTEEDVVEGALSPLTEVHVEGKHSPGGKTLLMFEGAFSRFRRLTGEEQKDVRRAWEQHPRGRRGRGWRNGR